jgi:predicted dehydrogenase
VYSEKPLAADAGEGRELLALARRRGLLVGCAPDTFLAGAWDTARELIAAGAIGRPVGASAAMHTAGPELWHPDPAFFYRRGGGPLFDMGPYYLTALASLLGPVARATGLARVAPAPRVVASGPLAGTPLAVEVATHVAAALDFRDGAVATLVTSFDVPTRAAGIVVHGESGVLHLPDPNYFAGPVLLQRPGERRGRRVRIAPTRPPRGRGLGVLDLAEAIGAGRPPRASGELALHVLDVMESVLGAVEDGRTRELAEPGVPLGAVAGA